MIKKLLLLLLPVFVLTLTSFTVSNAPATVKSVRCGSYLKIKAPGYFSDLPRIRKVIVQSFGEFPTRNEYNISSSVQDFDVPEILHAGITYKLEFVLQEAACCAPVGYLYLTEGSLFEKRKVRLTTDLSGNLYDVSF